MHCQDDLAGAAVIDKEVDLRFELAGAEDFQVARQLGDAGRQMGQVFLG